MTTLYLILSIAWGGFAVCADDPRFEEPICVSGQDYVESYKKNTPAEQQDQDFINYTPYNLNEQ